MALNFGGLFEKGIFKPSPEDDEFLHFEGNNVVAGGVTKGFAHKHLNFTADLPSDRWTALNNGSVTLTDLKPTQKVLVIFTGTWDTGSAGEGIWLKVSRDGTGSILDASNIYEAANEVGAEDKNIGFAISGTDIPTASTHTYTAYGRGWGCEDTDFITGKLTLIVFNSAG